MAALHSDRRAPFLLVAGILALGAFPARPALGQPLLPEPPRNVVAYSDYHTKTSLTLSWDDPAHYDDGSHLSGFDVLIYRGAGNLIGRVGPGVKRFVDEGLRDGAPYTYRLTTREWSLGFEGPWAEVSGYAGGDPVPGVPTEVTVTREANRTTVSWINPTTQRDGSPLDDFAGIIVFRDYLAYRINMGPGAVGAPGHYGFNSAFPPETVFRVASFDNERFANTSEHVRALETPAGPRGRFVPDRPRLVALGGGFNEQFVDLYNDGYEELSFEVSDTPEWLSISPSAGTVAVGEHVTFDVRAQADGSGYRTGFARFVTNAVTPILELPVDFWVTSDTPTLFVRDFEPGDSLVFDPRPFTASMTDTVYIGSLSAVPALARIQSTADWLTPGTGAVIPPQFAFERVTLIADLRNEAPGEHFAELQILNQSYAQPPIIIPVRLTVRAAYIAIARTEVTMAAPWNGSDTVEWLRVTNPQTGFMNLRISVDPPVSWLRIDPKTTTMGTGASRDVQLVASTRGLDPGRREATLVLTADRVDDPVLVPIRFDVEASPPKLVASTQPLRLVRRSTGSSSSEALLVRNPGFEPLDVDVADRPSWMGIAPRVLHLPGGSAGAFEIRAGALGLPDGDREGTITLRTNDPERPSVAIPATLSVVSPPAGTDRGEAGIREIGVRCGTILDPGDYIMIGMPDDLTPLPAGLRLRVEDSRGDVVLDAAVDAATSPRFLFGTGGFATAAHMTPDRTIDPVLDRRAGSVALYRAEAPSEPLHRFLWGPGAPVDFPGSGQSLVRGSSGVAVSVTQNPRNARGDRAATGPCDCPENRMYLAYQETRVPSAHGMLSRSQGTVAFDLTKGTLSVDALTWSPAIVDVTDIFTVSGVPTGEPVPVTATLEILGTLAEPPPSGTPPEVTATLSASGIERPDFGQPPVEPVDFIDTRTFRWSSAADSSFAGALKTTFVVGAGDPFPISAHVGATPGSAAARATASARWIFSGLPAGARLTSCRGFQASFGDPLPPEVLDARVDGATARIVWALDDPPALVPVYRSRSGGAWRIVGIAEPQLDGQLVFEDSGLEWDADYAWRLEILGHDTGETALATEPLRFGIRELAPNPTRGALSLTFDTPDRTPVVVELFDVAGRRVSRRTPEIAGPGRYTVDVTAGIRPVSGVYFLRLSRGSLHDRRKIVVAR